MVSIAIKYSCELGQGLARNNSHFRNKNRVEDLSPRLYSLLDA